jgi:hypothetical protein
MNPGIFNARKEVDRCSKASKILNIYAAVSENPVPPWSGGGGGHQQVDVELVSSSGQ